MTKRKSKPAAAKNGKQAKTNGRRRKRRRSAEMERLDKIVPIVIEHTNELVRTLRYDHKMPAGIVKELVKVANELYDTYPSQSECAKAFQTLPRRRGETPSHYAGRIAEYFDKKETPAQRKKRIAIQTKFNFFACCSDMGIRRKRARAGGA